MSALQQRLSRGAVVVLDGGFSTACETRGANLNVGKLWSARLIADDPAMVKAVHTDFLLAGSDIVCTASYQGTMRGFNEAGYSLEAAATLLRASVTLAAEARDDFWAGLTADGRDSRERPMVAASLGPFGAYLGDGSEYTGAYSAGCTRSDAVTVQKLTKEELMAFHREQVTEMAGAGADVLLFETVPCVLEGEAIAALLPEFPGVEALLSFSCVDSQHLSSGEPLSAVCVEGTAVHHSSQILGIGANCTQPDLIARLLHESLLPSIPSDKAVLAYGNSGEEYTAGGAGWSGCACGSLAEDYGIFAADWMASVASEDGCRRGMLVGGCCRTSPDHIAAVAAAAAKANMALCQLTSKQTNWGETEES